MCVFVIVDGCFRGVVDHDYFFFYRMVMLWPIFWNYSTTTIENGQHYWCLWKIIKDILLWNCFNFFFLSSYGRDVNWNYGKLIKNFSCVCARVVQDARKQTRKKKMTINRVRCMCVWITRMFDDNYETGSVDEISTISLCFVFVVYVVHLQIRVEFFVLSSCCFVVKNNHKISGTFIFVCL